MKAKRFLFRAPTIFGTPLKYGVPIFIGFTVLISGLDAQGGDILRGGSPAANKPNRAGSNTRTAAATDAARANAKDTLARTTKTLNSIRAMQDAARQTALKNGKNNLGKNPFKPTVDLPDVPNGLVTGGLKISGKVTTDPTLWTGAKLPVQETKKNGKTTVTIQQTEQQALLNWETFNVGKKTTVTFDQSKGGADVGKWIAFNKINDPTGNPTQILGNIKADGQVYLINTNGIIFGGSSQVNARGLTVSSLPINDNLVGQGLLNNRDAQFLFSGLKVPGGSDGTPDFNPEAPISLDGKFGDVTVQAGARLTSPADSGGSGGRIMLVGPNVTNEGSISTESGQTVLAAGLQVGVAAHDGNDPSLRGLDVWVGEVGTYGGTATNSGIIEAMTGSVSVTGKAINQLGMIESSTSVSLNGRIDLRASYGAVSNPDFDITSSPIFLNQFTGIVTIGEGDVVRILPDYLSDKAVPGTALPERSQINIEGLAIHFDKKSTLFAPNAEVSLRAGTWPYKDTNGDRTIFDNTGEPERNLATNYNGTTQRFFFDQGQIYIDQDATLNVAGSVDVFVPLAQSILTVELRGNELADSPLQRASNLRGVSLTVDIRNTGVYDGKYWIGTPLGDVTGLAGLIERNAAQLTAVGGNINIQAGESIVLRKNSSLDVSGGFLKHEAGPARTSYLTKGGRLVSIEDATPDVIYDGVFNGSSTFSSEKWGVTETYETPLFAGNDSDSQIEGAAGGNLSLTAPGMALDGELRGITVDGPRQRATPPLGSSIKINFESEKTVLIGTSTIYLNHSPTPPAISFAKNPEKADMPEFSFVNDSPAALSQGRLDSVVLDEDLLDQNGFDSLEVVNSDGSILVPENVSLEAAPKGAITLVGGNVTVLGSIVAPGGKISLTAYNFSPSAAAEYSILFPTGSGPFPSPRPDRGLFTLGKGAVLSTAGLIADDRPNSSSAASEPIITSGGEISIRSYSADLMEKSVVDVSGGVFVSDKAAKTYGKGGTISIITGNDAGFTSIIGGSLSLESKLRGYSGSTGGTLTIQSGPIQIGGVASPDIFHLDAGFFREGGFTKYSLSGYGAGSTATPPEGQLESYIPAISIAADTVIRPRAESLAAEVNPKRPGQIRLVRFVNDEGLRSPVSLSFTGLGLDDPFTEEKLEVRADIVMGIGASIQTEAGAEVSFRAGTVTLLGSVITPGGKISISGANVFPLTANQRQIAAHAQATVHLGKSAFLSAVGVVDLTPDSFGRRIGNVLDGGSITITGNILAEKGSALDVSGTSGILDLSPASLATPATQPVTGGLGSVPPIAITTPTRIDSDGGSISLTGGQMLLSDAKLSGVAGGTSALGGTLSLSSGRFRQTVADFTTADTNLIISQDGDVITNPNQALGVGSTLRDSAGLPYGDMGIFSLDRFTQGAFSSLSLAGNIEFQGPINLDVSGALRLATGGVISTTDSVKIQASYISIGQEFLAPQHPDDILVPFSKVQGGNSLPHTFAPVFGTGSIVLNAELIDVGTLSLQNIGKLDLTAKGGDIRGNGTLSVAGDVVLSAAKIYPTSLAAFDIFAYDHAGISGSVTIRSSGKSSEIPLSAGGRLGIYSSIINQQGVLRAPLGTITLGWDGTDLDPTDSDLDSPFNIISGTTISAPITEKLTLADGSLTSVSAATEKGQPKWIAPFGISPDGQTWIDPRGVNVTLSGLPEKSVLISGESVNMDSGAVVDIRGGGELSATRWVPGLGGSIDFLGAAEGAWSSGTAYQAGDLVSFGGATWSARTRHSGQTPTSGLFWTKVEESFAIVPDFDSKFAPYNPFNTGANADNLGGSPGLVSSGLKIGDTITLEAGSGLPAGTYTLLPRAYAVLDGAYLVKSSDTASVGSVTNPEGATLVSGYISNAFNRTETAPELRSRYEVMRADIVKNLPAWNKDASYQQGQSVSFNGENWAALTSISGKAPGTNDAWLNLPDSYEVYSANEFIAAAGGTQQLPQDAGYAGFHGNSALRLAGKLLTAAPGLGARVDVSSFADIRLSDSATALGAAVIQTSVLTSWGAESLVIGGLRQESNGETSLTVRTNSLVLDNPGETLSGTDIVLASNQLLEVTAGSSLTTKPAADFLAEAITVSGDGTLIRVSADAAALTTRTAFAGATTAAMKLGDAAKISGESVILDSTYGSDFAANLRLNASALILGSGQISLVLGGASGNLVGSTVDPQLVLTGSTLDRVFASDSLTLRSYRSIDIYGTGDLGSAGLGKLTLSSSGVRGYGQAGGNVAIRAGEVIVENSIKALALAAPATASGSFTVNADIIRLGENSVSIHGFNDLNLNASSGLIVDGAGNFSTTANLTVVSPLISGEARTSYSISSSGAMVLQSSGGKATSGEGLGAGLTLQAASIFANSDILLPSGQLTLRATTGNLSIGGNLSVEGSMKIFDKLTRYADAGEITLESRLGEITLSDTAELSVAAAVSGGNAGQLNVIVPAGTYTSAGKLLSSAAAGFTGGGFKLDTGSLLTSTGGTLRDINGSLASGGFTHSRDFRIRNGDVLIDHNITSHSFFLAADQGNITLTGKINAAGTTGGHIALAAHGNLTLESGSGLTVKGEKFDSAGKGGSILLEAGSQRNGVANTAALLNLKSGARLDLSVTEFVAGSYTTPGSSAFEGKFTGTLHLRAPRTTTNDGLNIATIGSNITGASSIVAEGFKVYTPANGVLNIALRNQINTEAVSFLGTAGLGNANEVAMRAALIGADSPLDSIFIITPGSEIINRTGNLTLGLANNTSAGSNNVEALAAADWNLSAFRYGIKSAPGVLTLRAQGDVIFNNTLSDGFNPITLSSDNGDSQMWLGTLMTIRDTLPTNTQSWSYRITAGADTDSSGFRSVLAAETLNSLQPGKGSVLVGEFYPAVPNSTTTGTAAAIGLNGQTADTIRISTTATNRGNRFEVIRTGTGDITISAGRDVQLRNQFSTIYTAGVALPTPTTVFSEGDFVSPNLPTAIGRHPSQTGLSSLGNLGAVQQLYPAAWSMAGGNVALNAAGNIGRYTLVNGILTVDTSRQMPTNWLYRRGYVDPATGLFAMDGGFGTNPNPNFQNPDNVTDVATSTTWWIDFSNFFQGIGTLGGGNIDLTAGNDIINVDAVAPTNARMAGRKKNPDFGIVPDAPEYLNLRPDAENLLELGGGDVAITAGRNISGGIYYVEKGAGSLTAGGEITTNSARSINPGILNNSAPADPLAWLPTTLFVGKSSFDVTARGDVLLGSVSNTFLLSQGINNKYWYKTYFSTFSADAGANVISLGGNVAHRTEASFTSVSSSSTNLLATWFSVQSFYDGTPIRSSHFQPWLRSAEANLDKFNTVYQLSAPNLRSTALGGNVSFSGDLTLAPSASGDLEIAAAEGIIGLNQVGAGTLNLQPVKVWTSSTVNVSDAAPESIPGIENPLAYQVVAGRNRFAYLAGSVDILAEVSRALNESGSYAGAAATQNFKAALHDEGILHRNDKTPITLFAGNGDITGLTLFAPKQARIIAERDITDVSLYLQNNDKKDATLVSAGRDIIPFNEFSEIRTEADDILLGNYTSDSLKTTVEGTTTRANAGDIRISGPGVLEVISGRNLDLGTGLNLQDGTGTGISSIGNLRNPYLPFGGASVITLAGVTDSDGIGPARGLSDSSLQVDRFFDAYLSKLKKSDSAYWKSLGGNKKFEDLTDEQKAIITLEQFYLVLRDAGRVALKKTGDYQPSYKIVNKLFGKLETGGEVLTRSREIRTTSGGNISIGVPDGGITLASQISGNPLTPPGIVTEFGGSISTVTDQSVNLGQARIFTLRGGDIVMWSSNGDIAAGSSPRTVVTAPPTRVVFDTTSASVQTDLGGLATGGGIGVLAAVAGVKEGEVDLFTPRGFVDAGEAGIRATGNLNIGAQVVLNSGNISTGGTSTGTSTAAPSAPSVATVTTASNSAAASTQATNNNAPEQKPEEPVTVEDTLSLITVDIIGYGDATTEEEEEETPEQ